MRRSINTSLAAIAVACLACCALVAGEKPPGPERHVVVQGHVKHITAHRSSSGPGGAQGGPAERLPVYLEITVDCFQFRSVPPGRLLFARCRAGGPALAKGDVVRVQLVGPLDGTMANEPENGLAIIYPDACRSYAVAGWTKLRQKVPQVAAPEAGVAESLRLVD